MIKKKYVLIIFTIIYLSSYIEVRHRHLLVHSSSFTSNHDGIKLTYSHKILPTDVIGLLQPSLFYTVVLANFIYQPLMVAEKMYWYVVEPRESIWPYEVEDT